MVDTTIVFDSTIEIVRIYIICRCLYLIIFAIGIIGNIFNLIVFYRKKFHSNSCSIYFIVYSINNFLNLTVGLFLWSLTLGFNFDLENKSVIYCKIRRYFTHINFLLSSCLLTLASINRYARVRQAQLSPNRYRYIIFCKHRTTYIIVLSTILFCFIANIHIPLFFRIDDGECYARVGSYRLVFDIFFLILYAIFPPIIMFSFNIATVTHIRDIRRLVHPRVSRREYHLIALVIAHSVANFVLTLPFTVNKFIYYTFEQTIPAEQNKLIKSITLLIAFMNPALSFFLYTLTTRSFRREFVRAWKELLIKTKHGCHRNSDRNEQLDTTETVF